MGFTFQDQRPVAEQLSALLQKRRCLLILDNFEHLIQPEALTAGESTIEESTSVDFIIKLLEQAPQLQLLITSRIPLDLSSEFMVRLSGLPVPAVELPTDAATYASIRLFTERATRITDHFHLEHELNAVAAIRRFVAGMPLGIELAAAWSGSRTPIEILFALQANLDFLTTRRRDIPPRQRSMRAVFDHSWQLLSATNQHVLTQVACFKGGFTAEAAQSIVANLTDRRGMSQDLAKSLHSLVHQALLQQDATGRYSIHPLLHEYADKKLGELCTTNREAKGETTGVVQRRHSHYYLDLVSQTSTKGWYTRAALAPIHTDLDNVRQAWQWASDHDNWAGLTLGWLGLWHFYSGSALFAEGEEVFRAALERLETQPSIEPAFRVMVAQLQVAHATFLNALGRHREAVTVAQSATAFAEATADDALKARGYAAWGTGLYRQGQYPAALALLAQGLTVAQTAQLTQVAANLHKRLANTLQATHDFDRARSHYAEALALYRQDDNRPGEGEALNGLGWCHQQQHDLTGAIESKSGLAATQLALHMREKALTLVQEILDFLAGKSLAGAREPMLVYWNCYQVSEAKRDPRATVLLHTANQQLTEQAAKLADQKLQRTFLENVRPHHALRRTYQERPISVNTF